MDDEDLIELVLDEAYNLRKKNDNAEHGINEIENDMPAVYQVLYKNLNLKLRQTEIGIGTRLYEMRLYVR